MTWTKWLVLILVLVNAGWMLFDGARALALGDYVTPKSGEHAGQLGPWARLVEALGIPARSTAMKLIFVVYGFSYLAATIGYLKNVPGARSATAAMAVLGLWYLPFGSLINVIVVTLLYLTRSKGKATVGGATLD